MLQPPSGDKIAAEVEREMEDHLYALRHVVIPPSEYHVYLHSDDFAHIEGIVHRVVEDVQICLNKLVKKLNTQSGVTKIVRGPRAPIEIPPGGWVVHIRSAANGEIKVGELGIHSRLSMPVAPSFAGAGTVRVFQTKVSGTERSTVVRDEPASASQTAQPSPLGAAATLMYRDDRGQHVFKIEKELIKIGRGGTAHWVDVTVAADSKVSREHCRIRRDRDGRHFVQDVSQWGTTVNDVRMAKYVDNRDSRRNEVELLDGASIGLAEIIIVTFRLGQ